MTVPVPVAVSTAALAVFAAGPLKARLVNGPKLGALMISTFGTLLSLGAAVFAGVSVARVPAWPSAVALAIAAIAPAAMLGAALKGRGVPRINDVTTDVDDPPAFPHSHLIPENAKRDMSFPAANRELVRRGYPDLKPVILPGGVDDVFDRARRVAISMPGWMIAAADPTTRTIEASQESGVFRFVDDVVIRVRPAPNGVRVDVRSKSREGVGDLGANAARIRRFLARLTSPV